MSLWEEEGKQDSNLIDLIFSLHLWKMKLFFQTRFDEDEGENEVELRELKLLDAIYARIDTNFYKDPRKEVYNKEKEEK